MIFIFSIKKVYTPQNKSTPPKQVYNPQNKSTPSKQVYTSQKSLHPKKVYTPQKSLHPKKSTPPQAEDSLSEEQLVAVRVLRLETVPVGRIPFR